MRDFIGEQATGARTGLVSDIDQQVADARTRLVDTQEQLQAAVDSGQITPEIAEQFITDEQFKVFQSERQREADYLRGLLGNADADFGQQLQMGVPENLMRRLVTGELDRGLGVPAAFSWSRNDAEAAQAANLITRLQEFGIDDQEVARLARIATPYSDEQVTLGMGGQGNITRSVRGDLQTYDELGGQYNQTLRDFGINSEQDYIDMLDAGGGNLAQGYLMQRLQGPQSKADLIPMLTREGVNLASTVTGTIRPEDVNRASVASPEQLARYQALAQLGGVEDLEILPEQRVALPDQGASIDLNAAFQEYLRSVQSGYNPVSGDVGTREFYDRWRNI
jgi:hypothetical protein